MIVDLIDTPTSWNFLRRRLCSAPDDVRAPPHGLAPQARRTHPAPSLVSDQTVPSMHGLPSQARQCLCAVARLRSEAVRYLEARGDDACTAPRLASPAFASSTSPVLAPQIRHGLQTGSSSFLGAAAGEALGFRLTLLNFKVRVQLLLLNLCSELAEFDAFGAPPSSRTCTCTPALSLDPAHAFRSSCILLAHNTPLPLRRGRALTSRRSTLRPTTTGHACLPPRHAPRSPERDCLCQRGRSLRPRPSQSLTPPECRDHPDSTSHFCL